MMKSKQTFRLLPLTLLVLASLNLAFVAPGSQKSQVSKSADLIEFSSDEGMKRFESSGAKVDFFTLANQFEAQSNGIFCGPTSVAIVLNSLPNSNGSPAPKDRSRFKSSDLQNIPKTFDPALPRYTQDNIFIKSPKSRASVFGKPVEINGKTVKDFGFQLRQLKALLQRHGLKTQLRVVTDKMNSDTILEEMVANLKNRDDYIIVNYKRALVGQKGGGHISPVGAYDAASDSFLILDVNPSKADWVWMSADTLIKGMRSFDTVENRGYILVSQ